MAARPTWRGFLRISLINIPIKVFPATESSAAIGFNQLHAECQTRIRQKRWCPTCDREVEYCDIVKGYEFERGRHVVVTDQDLQKVRGGDDARDQSDPALNRTPIASRWPVQLGGRA